MRNLKSNKKNDLSGRKSNQGSNNGEESSRKEENVKEPEQ